MLSKEAPPSTRSTTVTQILLEHTVVLLACHHTTEKRSPDVTLEALTVCSEIMGSLLVERIGSIWLEKEELEQSALGFEQLVSP